MSKEKQIEDMAEIMRHSCEKECRRNKYGEFDCEYCEAELLYTAGYRKQSEGEWIELKRFYASGKNLIHYQCNLCGVYLAKQANFCPHCGAKMKGV
jgi:hypothetical protein